ncbi:hypothetical protein O181_003928 [Austropuccinia psidii MF-1]|uniref:Uncharacterized protein n=1 Tax=Austropuccinia psidii MF-1 TaxID=1389203 RepID=A0A9Q3GE11_9BASI|nr:hypothetical protein [Austropuccinia psidii MF-1]
MEIINYVDGIFIDVPSVPDYRITARMNTELKGHASICYTEMKEIHCRRNWPWWKSKIIQKYSNGACIWKKTISFSNDNYSLDKDRYKWCLRQCERVKGIHPQMNIQKRNHKLLTQMPGELEHAVTCRCKHDCTLDDIANTRQDIRKRTNIWKYSPYKSSDFKEKQLFMVEFKDKPRERVAEVAKKKNYCHNCGSTENYTTNFPKENKNIYAIEKVPEEESPTEDSESYSMGDAISAKIHRMHRHSWSHQPKATIDHRQWGTLLHIGQKLTGNHVPNWEKQLLPTKAKNFKISSGKMALIEKIIKEIIIPPRKGNIRLNREFVVLDDAQIQGLLLGTDYQRMYGIYICNVKNRHITIGTNKEKKFSLDIYQISAQDPLEELLNEFR